MRAIHADVEEILQGIDFIESSSRQIISVARQTRTKFKMSKEDVVEENRIHSKSTVLKLIGKMTPDSTSRMEQIQKAEQARRQIRESESSQAPEEIWRQKLITGSKNLKSVGKSRLDGEPNGGGS